MLIRIWKAHKPLWIALLVWFVLGALLLLVYGSSHAFYLINGYYSHGGDHFWPLATLLGDGLIFIPLGLVFAFKGMRYLFAGGIGLLFSTFLVQLGKLFLFPNHPRPWKALHGSLHVVSGYKPYNNNSFPSGHTATAFLAFILIALFFLPRRYGPLALLLGLIVGYSRVYLGQHFVSDVYAGSWIGTISAIATYLIFLGKREDDTYRLPYHWLDYKVPYPIKRRGA